MSENIIIAIIVGTLTTAVGAIVTALAILYATQSFLWYLILLAAVVTTICSIATLLLFIWAQRSKRPFLWPALLINLAICLIAGGFIWQFNETEARNVLAWIISKGAAQEPWPPRKPRPHAPSETCANFRSNRGIETYCASSVLEPQAGNIYDVQNLFSTNNTTAWVHGTHKTGIDQWIVVEFDGFRSVNEIMIRNGYQKNADVYISNSRVKELKLLFSQGESKTVLLEDRQSEQTIPIDPPIKAYWIQFRIEDVFPGTRWLDTAISKLQVISEPVPGHQ